MDPELFFEDLAARDWQESDPDAGPVRFALIGLGWWTVEQAIPAIEDSQLCETTVTVSSSAEKSRQVAADVPTVEAGITYEEFHAGEAADAYDAVYVCTPNALHDPYVETAADLGKAVLCEKPMAESVATAEGMVETVADAGIPFMVAYRLHTDPVVRRFRELLDAGLLGDPVQCHGYMNQPLLEVIPDPDQWRLDPDLAGPGASVTDIGIYPLNTTRFLLDADPVGVTATAWTDPDNEAFADVPDERVGFTLEFPGGVTASCAASQNAYRTSHLTVVGTEGQATLDPAFFGDRPRELTVRSGAKTVSTSVEGVDQMREEFDYFADCVLADRPPAADGGHGLVDMRAIEAVYESAARGERVSLAEFE